MQTYPEHGKGIKTDRNADIIYDTCPEVSRCQPNIALLIRIGCLHYDGAESQNGLQQSVLQDTTFDSEEGLGIRDVNLWEEMIERPGMGDRRAAMSHDNHSPLAAEEVDEELEEGIDCECLAMPSVNEGLSDSRPEPHIPRRYHEQDPETVPPLATRCSSMMILRKSGP